MPLPRGFLATERNCLFTNLDNDSLHLERCFVVSINSEIMPVWERISRRGLFNLF